MQVKQLLRKLEAKHPEGLSTAQQFLASEDLLPVPEEQKTWNHWSFVCLYPDHYPSLAMRGRSRTGECDKSDS
jgi:cytosine/uracil/thiamine/allantoin permease